MAPDDRGAIVTAGADCAFDWGCEHAESGLMQDGATQFKVGICHGPLGIVKAHEAVLEVLFEESHCLLSTLNSAPLLRIFT